MEGTEAIALPHNVLHIRGCFNLEAQQRFLDLVAGLAAREWNQDLLSKVEFLVAHSQKGPWVSVYYKWEAHQPSTMLRDSHGEELFRLCQAALSNSLIRKVTETMPDNARLFTPNSLYGRRSSH